MRVKAIDISMTDFQNFSFFFFRVRLDIYLVVMGREGEEQRRREREGGDGSYLSERQKRTKIFISLFIYFQEIE